MSHRRLWAENKELQDKRKEIGPAVPACTESKTNFELHPGAYIPIKTHSFSVSLIKIVCVTSFHN